MRRGWIETVDREKTLAEHFDGDEALLEDWLPVCVDFVNAEPTLHCHLTPNVQFLVVFTSLASEGFLSEEHFLTLDSCDKRKLDLVIANSWNYSLDEDVGHTY